MVMKPSVPHNASPGIAAVRICKWWSTSAFSTNEGVLNFFREQTFGVLNLSPGWGAKLEAFYKLAPQHY